MGTGSRKLLKYVAIPKKDTVVVHLHEASFPCAQSL